MICITRFKGVFLIGLKNYPRRCGEHVRNILGNVTTKGSSPRVRGTYPSRSRPGFHAGLIPAGAGNMQRVTQQQLITRGHPRGCGEHYQPAGVVHADEGSSPRVRGTWVFPTRRRRAWGLIPAGAGNIVVMASSCACVGAHPRGCGEHVASSSAGQYISGSSPQVRGTFFEPIGLAPARGLIPAGAGNIAG